MFWIASKERANKGRILSHFVLQPSKDPNVRWHGQLSPDGRVMAVKLTPDEVKFYETATGRCCGSVLAPSNIDLLDFSPDGKTLATSCADTSILLWDIR